MADLLPSTRSVPPREPPPARTMAWALRVGRGSLIEDAHAEAQSWIVWAMRDFSRRSKNIPWYRASYYIVRKGEAVLY